MFLDDGCGTAQTFEEALFNSNTVKTLLKECGFVINEEKSVWLPSKVLTWLGVVLDMNKNHYHVFDRRIKPLLESCHHLLASPYTTARKLSRLAGKVVSTKFVLSNIVRLKTRFLYRTIDKQFSWDAQFNILDYPEAHNEIEI